MQTKVGLTYCKMITLGCFLTVPFAYADVLESSTISLVDAQYNSSSWAASNLLDNSASTRWLSRNKVNDINFVLNGGTEAACFSGFDLTNYGNDDRSVKQFTLLTTNNAALSLDKGTLGWKPIVADANPSSLIDYLSWAQGARLLSIDSQYNSSSWAAKNIHDGSPATRWLSRKSNNIFEFNFDTDWNGSAGDGIPISEIEVINYGNDDRSVKEFQVEVTTDGTVWTKLEVPGSVAGDIEYTYTRRQDGGILGNIDSQYNSSSWGAANMHDGDQNTRWLSSKGNNTIEFTFDPNYNEITGANGDIVDMFSIDKIRIENYGNDDRSVNEFQVAVKTLALPDAWQKITVPGAVVNQADYNFAMSHHGGVLVNIDDQYNSSSWAAKNIHDGDQNTRWLSRKGNNSLTFQFDADENGDLGTASDLFTLKSFYLGNYGADDRAIREFQLAVKTTTNDKWTKITVPDAEIGEANYNFLLSHHGAKLTSIISEYNATSWAAKNIHDGDQNTRWLSNKSNNTLDFNFNLNEDETTAGAADVFKLESFYLINYGNDDRSVKQFQLEVKTLTNSNWTKIPVAGAAAIDANFNYALTANGGSLTVIDSEYNATSWGASNIHDGDQNTTWLSRKQDNTLTFTFDTNPDGIIGDPINLDTISLDNYGNNSRAIKTFEIDIQISAGAWQTIKARGNSTIFRANKNSTTQSWPIGPYTNVTATRIRTLSNYGDSRYTGAREIKFSGTKTGPFYTFTAAMHSNGETFAIDAADQPIDVTAVRFRTINNYGDPSYIGVRELKMQGPSVAKTKTFVASMHGNGETFTLAADDIVANVTEVKLITINNYGDPSYIGAKEFKLLGPSVTKTKTFIAAMHGDGETFQLDVDDIPTNVTEVKLITINNHGDPSYVGIGEFEVIGVSQTPAHTFVLPMTDTPYTITLDNDDWVSDIIGARIVTIKNYGDPSYTGLGEVKLLGNAITPSYIFDAEMNTAVQSFNFTGMSANIFRFHNLNNHGDPSYTGAADFVLNSGVCPAAAWQMDEASWSGASDEVIDSTGSGYDGLAVGFGAGDEPTTYGATPAIAGDPGTCRYGGFDGVDDYIAITDGDSLDNLNQFTLSAWIKADSFTQTNGRDARGVFSKGPDGINAVSYGAFFSNDGTNRLNVDIDGANNRFASNTVFTLDTWYHLAIVFDGSLPSNERVKLYVDGVLDGTFSETSNIIPDTNADFYIGNFYSAVNELKVFDGSIDEVNMKPTALQASGIVDLMNTSRPCAEPLDHIEISHDGSALTCSAETLTIKACADATCSSVLASDINVTLSPTGAASNWSQNPITIPGGSTAGIAVDIHHTSAETVTLSASSDPISFNTTVCIPSCDLPFADSGYLLTLDNHQSCTAANLSIQAVKLSDTGINCAPAYTGDQPVDFSFNYTNPLSGTKVPVLANTAMAAAGVSQNRTISFDATGSANLSFEYQDAGQVTVDVSDGALAGLSASSITTVVSPAKLMVTSVDANADCASNDANCTAFKAAGESFNLSVSAACSDDTITPNFTMNNIPLSVNIVAPLLPNPVSLAVNSINIVPQDNGVHTESGQSISEVGVFTITATPPNNGYFGVTVPAGISSSLGRFTPAHFTLAKVFDGALSGGTPFVYTGQMASATEGQISYLIEPEFTITAKSVSGDTTLNYTGDFLKLQADDIIRAIPTNDATQLGADAINKVELTANINTTTLTESAGVINYQFNSSDNYHFTRNANAIIAPYIADIDLQITAISDDDGISAQDDDTDNTNGILTIQPTGVEIRFGRWVIENSFGPETSTIKMPMYTQYWNGAAFVINTSDSFTPFDTATDAFITNISLAPAVTTASGDGTFVFGETESVLLSSPGANNQGEVSFSISAPTWLQYDWTNTDNNFDGPYNQNPSATATFGLYRTNDRIISWREVVN